MGTLFLIGNGFDLNCGMNTRFSDVYKEYIRTDSASFTISNFKRTIQSDIENWGDFEMAMADYASKLKNEEEFLECIRDFSSTMESFIDAENTRIKSIIKSKQAYLPVLDEMRKSMTGFYKGITHNVNEIMEKRNAGILSMTNVISFNYTDVFDVLFQDACSTLNIKNEPIIHIHGVLGDDPVLGVDNESQLIVPYELSNRSRREFIKPVFNNDYDSQRVENAKRLIAKADTICSYGLSWGLSDLTWREAIISWLTENDDRHLVCYNKKCSDIRNKRRAELLSIEEETKWSIAENWGMNKSEDILSRIHIPCGTNIFNIKDVISSVESEE